MNENQKIIDALRRKISDIEALARREGRQLSNVEKGLIEEMKAELHDRLSLPATAPQTIQDFGASKRSSGPFANLGEQLRRLHRRASRAGRPTRGFSRRQAASTRRSPVTADSSSNRTSRGSSLNRPSRRASWRSSAGGFRFPATPMGSRSMPSTRLPGSRRASAASSVTGPLRPRRRRRASRNSGSSNSTSRSSSAFATPAMSSWPMRTS